MVKGIKRPAVVITGHLSELGTYKTKLTVVRCPSALCIAGISGGLKHLLKSVYTRNKGYSCWSYLCFTLMNVCLI